MREIIRNNLIKVYEKLVFAGYRLDVKHRENLDFLRDSNIPALIYFNHLAGDDPVIISSLVSHYTGADRDLILPVSDEYIHFSGPLPLYAIGVLGARILLSWQTLPIVQSYRVRDQRLTKEQKEKIEARSFFLSKQFFQIIKKELGSEKKPVIILSPEGHRSRQGLLPAEGGVGLLTKFLKENNGLILPIGLIYQGGKRGLNYNPRHPLSVEVVIGSPLSYNQIVDIGTNLYQRLGLVFSEESEKISHTLMWCLAQLLTENLQGYYHPLSIRETLSGRYRLGIDNKGNMIVLENDKKEITK